MFIFNLGCPPSLPNPCALQRVSLYDMIDQAGAGFMHDYNFLFPRPDCPWGISWDRPDDHGSLDPWDWR